METFCKDLNLKNVYAHLHPQVPTTRYPGSKCIYFILTSADIEISKAGYTNKRGGASDDHRAMWIEVSYSLAIRTSIPKVINPQVNRIKCQDPGVLKEFNKKYSEFLQAEKVPFLLEQLQQGILPGQPLTETQKLLYKVIDSKKV